MIKLKFALDPKDKNQMLALSNFAGTLAGAGVSTVLAAAPAAVEAPKVEPENEAKSEEPEAEAPKPTKKRRRRTQAEIAADEAGEAGDDAVDAVDAVNGHEDDDQDQGEDAEEQDAEEGSGVSTAERKGKLITLDDIRAAVAEKKDNHFAKMKDELLERYGVASTPKLPVEHYAAFFDFVNGLK